VVFDRNERGDAEVVSHGAGCGVWDWG